MKIGGTCVNILLAAFFIRKLNIDYHAARSKPGQVRWSTFSILLLIPSFEFDVIRRYRILSSKTLVASATNLFGITSGSWDCCKTQEGIDIAEVAKCALSLWP